MEDSTIVLASRYLQTNGVVVAGAYKGGDKGQGEAYVYVKPAGGLGECNGDGSIDGVERSRRKLFSEYQFL